MFLKYIVYFVAILGILIYASLALQNRQKIKLKVFGNELEISLGFLIISAFLDGIIVMMLFKYF